MKTVFAYVVYKWMSEKKIMWVHPYANARLSKVSWNREKMKTIFFFNYFGMSVKSFDGLIVKLEDGIKWEGTKLRVAITPAEMYLGSGCSLVDLHYSCRVGRSTASKIVRNARKIIWITLKDECLPLPAEEVWLNIADLFFQKANFPNSIARRQAHLNCQTSFGRLSISITNTTILSCCYVWRIIITGLFILMLAPLGKNPTVLYRISTLWDRIITNTLNIPQSKPLHGTTRPQIPFAFVGEEAFGLHKHMVRPFSGRFLSHTKRIFNYCLSRARRYIECTFGILSNKWRIFHRPHNVNLDISTDIVKACCVLHNYVRSRDGYNVEDTLSIEGLEEVNDAAMDDSVNGGLHVNHIINIWAENFVSNVGIVPWQNDRIRLLDGFKFTPESSAFSRSRLRVRFLAHPCIVERASPSPLSRSIAPCHGNIVVRSDVSEEVQTARSSRGRVFSFSFTARNTYLAHLSVTRSRRLETRYAAVAGRS
ncbi:hypothetical protein PR048_026187 [Dryococelus australis]|uniref:DDE Tnp4 domain-containing protein n=1 Tax=Dryococelus australis TaxID=614101 RepID=A0ABQ9GKM4_9NEOP|nr:hypothetical protein PR048_026187 [Dryococelus australis]